MKSKKKLASNEMIESMDKHIEQLLKLAKSDKAWLKANKNDSGLASENKDRLEQAVNLLSEIASSISLFEE